MEKSWGVVITAIFFKLRVNHGSQEAGVRDENSILGPSLKTADAYREVFEAMVELAD